MKRIALYLDGTWNTPEDGTNVFTLFQLTVGDIAGPEILQPFVPLYQKPLIAIKNLVAPKGRHKWLSEKYKELKKSKQIRYYDQGVGTHLMNLLYGGAIGRGVSKNIQQAYEFLCYTFEPGDELFIFGFSRGAYTARSLVGLLNTVGLLSPTDCDNKTKRQAVYRYFHDSVNNMARQQRRPDVAEVERPGGDIPTVKFIGVWDTVGAMGVPDRFAKLARFMPVKSVYQALPNTEMCANVEHAYHAMAIDEHRIDFKPTLWKYPEDSTELPEKLKHVEQVWFAGSHSNVGGGYTDNYLNEIPFYWIQSKAKALNLAFHREQTPTERAITEPINDSYQEFAGGIHKLFSDRYYRPVHTHLPKSNGGVIAESIHPSVWDYYTENDYRPRNISAEVLAQIKNKPTEVRDRERK